MKITKRQLRRIIRETLLREADDMSVYDDITKAPLHMPPRPDKHTEFRSQADRDGEYNLGREDSFAGMRPQSSGKDYMRGYNEAQMDAGLPTMQAPSDSGRGKKLDPSKLKGAFVSSKKDRTKMKKYISKMAESDCDGAVEKLKNMDK